MHFKKLISSNAIGGLIGNSNYEIGLKECSSNGNIHVEDGMNINCGGFVGKTINIVGENCNNNTNISIDKALYSYLGGLAGAVNSNSRIKNSTNSGTIKVEEDSEDDCFAGGMIGQSTNLLMCNSENNGMIGVSASDDIYIGGLVGLNRGSLSLFNCNNSEKIAIGNEGIYTYDDLCIGGIVGESDGGIVNIYNCNFLNSIKVDEIPYKLYKHLIL